MNRLDKECVKIANEMAELGFQKQMERSMPKSIDLRDVVADMMFYAVSGGNDTPEAYKNRVGESLDRIYEILEKYDSVVEALKPFARYACEPLASCGGSEGDNDMCNNCKAAHILAKDSAK